MDLENNLFKNHNKLSESKYIKGHELLFNSKCILKKVMVILKSNIPIKIL